MEKRLDRIASVLTYLLIATLLFTVLILVGGCGDDKEITDRRATLFSSLKGSWVLESVELDEQQLQGFEELSITFEETGTPFLYYYQCANLPELSPWKTEGTWQFGSSIETEMTRDEGTEDELDIDYILSDNQLTINFTFGGDGYNNARVKSASGNWSFVLTKQ